MSIIQLIGIDPLTIVTQCCVNEFITSDNQWNHIKLSYVLPSNLVNIITSIPLPSIPRDDESCWGLSGSGQFSTKTATWMCHGSNNHTACEGNWTWKTDIPPKLKIFLWQLYHNSISLKGILIKRGVNIDPLSHLCQEEPETIDYLFLTCPAIHNHQWVDIRSLQTPSFSDGNHLLHFYHN